jgi:type I restriction enzyme S subunit
MSVLWYEATLNDVCYRITDGAHASPKSVDRGLPMASVKDMTPYGLNLETARQISAEDFAALVRQGCKPLVGDVLIAKDGATALDTVCVIQQPIETVLLSSVAILRPNADVVLPKFLRYYLDAESTRAYMKAAFTTGAAIPRVVLKDFKRARIRYPDMATQARICAALSAYDDLIENNTRRIAILEEMARRIYEEWFVRFRFPGHESVRMVESELGLVPEGWKARRLGDEIELAYGKALKAEDRRPGEVPVFGSSGIVGRHDESLVAGPGIIVGRKGNVGSVHWSESPFYPIDTVFYVVTGLPLQYVYFNLQRQNFLNNDAAVPGLNRNQAYSLPLIVPAAEPLAAFDGQCRGLLGLARVLAHKNENLRATRDLLLPKLISGELDVSALPEPETVAA